MTTTRARARRRGVKTVERRERDISPGDDVRWHESHDGESVECRGRAIWAANGRVGLESPIDGSRLSLPASEVEKTVDDAPGDELRCAPTLRERAARVVDGVRRRVRRLRAAW